MCKSCRSYQKFCPSCSGCHRINVRNLAMDKVALILRFTYDRYCGVSAADALSAKAEDVIELFQCPVCFDFVLPQIRQCKSGHLICGRCRPKLRRCPVCLRSLRAGVRNVAMETVAETLPVPCEVNPEWDSAWRQFHTKDPKKPFLQWVKEALRCPCKKNNHEENLPTQPGPAGQARAEQRGISHQGPGGQRPPCGITSVTFAAVCAV
ncbi:E3 ubiquitin-protein ligase siah2 [Amia ocellicauda]|uniref:E3 ubiquitin-protein ligase siah2 n=1 Tax=Amia ocellicauda TaxID=2972642 RepID=UPI003463C12D